MYKTVAPGCLGFGCSFMEAAMPAAAAGFEGYWFSIDSDSRIPAEQTREMLLRSGLRAAGFNLPVEFRRSLDDYERDMAQLPLYARYAAEIGALRCVTWISPVSDTLDFAENFELHRMRLKRAAEILKEHGILLGLEFIGTPVLRKNARYPFIHSLDQMLTLCEAIGTGNCGILMDVWHWDLAGHTRADFAKFTSPDQIVLAHINDAPAGVSKEDQKDGLRGLPGQTGVLRIGDFFEGLQAVGYTGPVLPEPFDASLKELTFEEALSTAMAAINRVWPKP